MLYAVHIDEEVISMEKYNAFLKKYYIPVRPRRRRHAMSAGVDNILWYTRIILLLYRYTQLTTRKYILLYSL